jgi:hypothetical protein
MVIVVIVVVVQMRVVAHGDADDTLAVVVIVVEDDPDDTLVGTDVVAVTVVEPNVPAVVLIDRAGERDGRPAGPGREPTLARIHYRARDGQYHGERRHADGQTSHPRHLGLLSAFGYPDERGAIGFLPQPDAEWHRP